MDDIREQREQKEQQDYPTVGQLERTISQQVRALYRSQFGHQPSKVDCDLLDNKLVISLENVITPVEKLLRKNNSPDLIDQVRGSMNKAIKSKIQNLIEEITSKQVTHSLYDTSVDTNYAGAIFILASPPQVRYSRASLKRKIEPKTKAQS